MASAFADLPMLLSLGYPLESLWRESVWWEPGVSISCSISAVSLGLRLEDVVKEVFVSR
jgi:hypothetical protein